MKLSAENGARILRVRRQAAVEAPPRTARAWPDLRERGRGRVVRRYGMLRIALVDVGSSLSNSATTGGGAVYAVRCRDRARRTSTTSSALTRPSRLWSKRFVTPTRRGDSAARVAATSRAFTRHAAAAPDGALPVSPGR